MTNALHRMEGELVRLRGVEESLGLKKRVADIREHLRFLMEAESVNTVFWIERRGGSALRQGMRNTYLQATPIDVSELLSSCSFEQYPSVILTSATLTVQGGFAHLRKRLGLRDARELIVPSHFRYEEQALLYLRPGMPDPREPRLARRRRAPSGGCWISPLAGPLSVHQLSEDPRSLRAPAAGVGLSLPAAGPAPAKRCWRNSQYRKRSALRNLLILARRGCARGSLELCDCGQAAVFCAHGSCGFGAHACGRSQRSNPFFDYQVPAAVITLKQAFGRLIRSLEDRGVLVLLDPRIERQRYGKVFLESLPPYRLTRDIMEVERFFAPG